MPVDSRRGRRSHRSLSPSLAAASSRSQQRVCQLIAINELTGPASETEHSETKSELAARQSIISLDRNRCGCPSALSPRRIKRIIVYITVRPVKINRRVLYCPQTQNKHVVLHRITPRLLFQVSRLSRARPSPGVSTLVSRPFCPLKDCLEKKKCSDDAGHDP